MNYADETLKEMRNALELDLAALQQWRNRETSEPVQLVLDKRIDRASHALNMVTSEKRTALLAILEGGSQFNDNVLIAALHDLKNWDKEMEDKWETMDMRINNALGLYMEGQKA